MVLVPQVRPAVARSFHVSAPALTSFEDSRIARPHCHHASLWKHWKPLAANGRPWEMEEEEKSMAKNGHALARGACAHLKSERQPSIDAPAAAPPCKSLPAQLLLWRRRFVILQNGSPHHLCC